MKNEREALLEAFGAYYGEHYRVMVEPDAAPGAPFHRDALRSLYDGYCRESAARLHAHIRYALNAVGGDMAVDGRRILDVTCFATTQVLPMMFPKARVSACDKHLRWAAFLEGVECDTCDLEKDPLPYGDASFDMVVFTETLEHIPRSPHAILAEVARVMKPGGLLVFSVPNLASLSNRVKLLLGADILSVDLFHADSFGHFREYSMREVHKLLDRAGLKIAWRQFGYYERPWFGRGVPLARVASRLVTGMVPGLRPVCMVAGTKG